MKLARVEWTDISGIERKVYTDDPQSYLDGLKKRGYQTAIIFPGDMPIPRNKE